MPGKPEIKDILEEVESVWGPLRAGTTSKYEILSLRSCDSNNLLSHLFLIKNVSRISHLSTGHRAQKLFLFDFILKVL